METVGIREMKAHFSAYLKKVQAEGSRVAVTDRGRIVAVLGPPEKAGTEPRAHPSLEERALARGGRPATQHGAWTDLPPAPPELRELDAQAILAELRGDR